MLPHIAIPIPKSCSQPIWCQIAPFLAYFTIASESATCKSLIVDASLHAFSAIYHFPHSQATFPTSWERVNRDSVGELKGWNTGSNLMMRPAFSSRSQRTALPSWINSRFIFIWVQVSFLPLKWGLNCNMARLGISTRLKQTGLWNSILLMMLYYSLMARCQLCICLWESCLSFWFLLSGVGLGTCLILHKYGFLSRNVFLLCTSTVFSLRIRCCLQVVLDSSYKCVCMSGFWLDMGFGIVNYVGRGLFLCSLVSGKWYRDLVVSWLISEFFVGCLPVVTPDCN